MDLLYIAISQFEIHSKVFDPKGKDPKGSCREHGESKGPLTDTKRSKRSHILESLFPEWQVNVPLLEGNCAKRGLTKGSKPSVQRIPKGHAANMDFNMGNHRRKMFITCLIRQKIGA
ncbi:unnamed protein product [Umbelopsis ramanniana]